MPKLPRVSGATIIKALKQEGISKYANKEAMCVSPTAIAHRQQFRFMT